MTRNWRMFAKMFVLAENRPRAGVLCAGSCIVSHRCNHVSLFEMHCVSVCAGAIPPLLLLGTWCSGITPAQRAGGPGLNPQCVHRLKVSCVKIRIVQQLERIPSIVRQRGTELKSPS